MLKIREKCLFRSLKTKVPTQPKKGTYGKSNPEAREKDKPLKTIIQQNMDKNSLNVPVLTQSLQMLSLYHPFGPCLLLLAQI
jgi:hypothetical protein